ncbi:MAG: hypothetical protein K2M19_04740 [Muribaculaceae bacterium]|nr:hypothetical protein [Muribaculaceae bacterium]
MNIKISHIISLLCFLLTFTGCSDDIGVKLPQNETEALTIYVPVAGRFDSRDADAIPDELKYTSLTFFAFPSAGDPVIVPLPVDDSSLTLTDIYRPYQIDLPVGYYHFYLVANVFDDETSIPQDEETLARAIWELADDFNCSLPASGLPMSASHTDFTAVTAAGTHALTSDPFYYDGNGGTLYAIMTFLYAKVTVEARDAAGNPVNVLSPEFDNLSSAEPVFFNDSFSSYGALAPVSPAMPEGDDIPEVLTFYIPERYVTATAAASQSTLSFTIGDKAITLPLGETATDNADDVNVIPAPDARRSIVRGTHYRYLLNTVDRITLEVDDWTPEGVSAALRGPVYLHVEKQEYEIQAGEETSIWFESDVPNVYVKSPKFNETDLYSYSVDPTADTIRVWVNQDIKSSDYDLIKQSIQAGEGKYDYFHIVAGPIHKRISVTPLVLDYFLRVNPPTIPIDVKLRVASGEYHGTIPVSVRTNYPELKVTLGEGWDLIPTDETDALTLNDADGAPVTLSSEAHASAGLVYYYLNFKGLNSGYKFWKDNHTLIINVTGIDSDGTERETVPVTVNVIPSMLNYKIHFRAVDENWVLPHIYVYQCLEFPGNYNQVWNGFSLASQPIGYQEGQNRFAALEYSFTGAVAFRGWDYLINHELLYNDNGTMKPFVGKREEGFFMFDDAGYDEWSPKEATSERYNFSMDFCKDHREYICEDHADFPGKFCPYCAWSNPSMNRIWAGIMMKPEGNGWYEFELSGVATPGKALIMFSDNHGIDAAPVNNQFPKGNTVGIPLFDYPSREGWFEYNGDVEDRVNNQFTSEKPASYDPEPIKPGTYAFRLYWPANTGMDIIHLWLTGDSDYGDVSGNWGAAKDKVTKVGDYYCYDFTWNISVSQVLMLHAIIFKNQGQGQDRFDYRTSWPLSTFSLASNGKYCAYIKSTNDFRSPLIPGIPDGAN